MSLTQNRWFRRVGFATIAALGLGLSAAAAAPAQAHDFGRGAPIAARLHHASFLPRLFFGFGEGHYRHGGDHWGHHWR